MCQEAVLNVVFYGDFYKHMFANTGIFSLLNFKEKNTYVFSSWESEVFWIRKEHLFCYQHNQHNCFCTKCHHHNTEGDIFQWKLILDDSRVDLFFYFIFFLDCFFSHVISILSMVVPLSFFRPLLKCHLFKRVVLPNNLT